MVVSERGNIKVLKDGQFYFIMAMYKSTPDFKLQEVAQNVVAALNKLEDQHEVR